MFSLKKNVRILKSRKWMWWLAALKSQALVEMFPFCSLPHWVLHFASPSTVYSINFHISFKHHFLVTYFDVKKWAIWTLFHLEKIPNIEWRYLKKFVQIRISRLFWCKKVLSTFMIFLHCTFSHRLLEDPLVDMNSVLLQARTYLLTQFPWTLQNTLIFPSPK